MRLLTVFFDRMVEKSSALEIGKPIVPRYSKPPKKFGGDTQHEFLQPREYYRHQYFEACDLLIQELGDRFEQKEIMQPVLSIEAIFSEVS